MLEDGDTRRLLKQAERDRRIERLYHAHPALKAMDDELADAGRQGLRIAMTGGGLGAAREKIGRAQERRRQMLANLGLDEGVYDVAWDCPVCEDRGYIRPGEPCGCRLRDRRSRYVADSGLSPLQKSQTFENFSLAWYAHPEEVGRLAGQVEKFANALARGEACGNLFLYGPVGNGKTHLCSAAANLVLAAGKSVAYFRAEELVEALREDIYGRGDRGDPAAPDDSGKLQDRLQAADLLILDDLGTERQTEFAEEQLTSLIDRRINGQKPWIITSQLIGDKLGKRYDQRLVDRVLGEGQRLYLNESSIRFKKAQKG